MATPEEPTTSEEVAAWEAWLEEALEKTGGPLTSDERDWADEVLGTTSE